MQMQIKTGNMQMPTNIKKIIILFVSVFASVVIPVLLGLVFGETTRLWMTNNPILLTLSFVIYTIFFFVYMTKMGEWTAKYSAVPGLNPATQEDLQNRLNSLLTNMPIQIIQDKNKILITWNYADAKFKYLVGAGKIRGGYKLILKFNEKKKEVNATEEIYKIEMGAGGILRFSLGFQASYFKGISLLNFDYSTGCGFQVKDGRLEFNKLYEYKFNPEEIKGAVIQLIINSGWDYAPRVFLG